MLTTEIPCRKSTTYRDRIYNRSRILKVVLTWEDLELICTTIKKPGRWMPHQFHLSLSVRNCVIIITIKYKV